MDENAIPSRDYVVRGMTCSHCVSSVTEEVSEIDGVEAVEADLESGRVVVRGAGFSDEDVRRAVSEAGYELAV